MLYHLATVALAPILLIQGQWVRRATPRLPEAGGARSGVDGTGPELRLLILGDSAAAGVGVDTQTDALSGRLAAALAQSCRTGWTLLAESGLDSAAILSRLQAEPGTTYDAAVISVGVNDVTALTSPARWVQNLQAIADLLRDKFKVRQILLSSVPPMHQFPALPQPLRWWLGTRARLLNQLAQQVATDHSHCQFVAVQFPFEPGYMAADGFHPGPAAYALWAGQLARSIRESLL